MAKGTVNRVILIGRLGADPDVRYMPSGDAITSISMATNEQWKDRNGQNQEHTEWHRIAFFGKTAEIAGQYLRKGSRVYIEGKLRTKKWQDQAGQDRYSTEIIADQMQMLDSRSSSGENNDAQYGQPAAASAGYRPRQNSGGYDDSGYGEQRSRPPVPPKKPVVNTGYDEYDSAGEQGYEPVRPVPQAPVSASKRGAPQPPPPDVDNEFDDVIPF